MQPSPAHLSPFIDNEEMGYIPDRQREINTLAGVATAEVDVDSSEDEEEEEPVSKKAAAEDSDEESQRGDADSSSDDESSEEEQPKKRELSAAQKAKKEAKLKADLQKEQQEMGKMMMTQRQRKLY